MKNSGWSFHCHHDTMLEYCTDFKGRVAYIKSDKPKYEQKTRLKLFKLLSNKAVKALPKDLVKAYADWQKADADQQKAYADRQKAYADWQKADADRQKADDDWRKADADWSPKAREAFHKKFCGCKEWNGEEIVFPEAQKQ